MDLDTLADLLALADGLEDEGQLNNAKLLRAAVDSALIRLARSRGRPADKAALLAGIERAIAALTAEPLPPEPLAALHMARLALESWRLPHYSEIPDPYVCRVCGYVTLQPDGACPDCGAHHDTFKRIRPVYWIEALDPPAALRHLRAMPPKVAGLIDPWMDTPASQAPEEGGWSLRQAVAHLPPMLRACSPCAST